MMRTRAKVLVAAIVAVVAIAAPIWLGRNSAPDDASRERAPADPIGRAQPESTSEPEAERTVEPAPDPSLDVDPRLREYTQRAQFYDRARTFFAQASSWQQPEKAERARALAQEISRYEAAGEIAAAEALILRTALIRETVEDPSAQAERITALHEHYRKEGERRRAEWEARTDPRHEQYKARERAIVAEVMAMEEIPGGLTRDEYLRRRLQSAREQAYQE